MGNSKTFVDLYPEFPDKNTLIKILNNIPGGIFVADKTGRVIFFDNNTPTVLHMSKDKLLQLNVFDMMELGMADQCPASVETLEKKEKIIKHLKNYDSERVICCTPVFYDNGELEMSVVYSQEAQDFEILVKKIEEQRELAKSTLMYLEETNEKNAPVLTNNKKMADIFEYTRKAAKSTSTIMITGESGTGKEVLARFVHKNSVRNKNAFIPINCAAIPRELLESEFFGYEKGAFTGANKSGKIGLFEMANNGTLFLDEIGELPMELQSKLLRVLETGEIRRIGSIKAIHKDVRIVASTNRNLKEMVDNGHFREDLYYRLNILPIRLPPLRNRKEDIELLATQFVSDLNKKYNLHKYLSNNSLTYFNEYSWPGNIRELKNIIERLFIISTTNELNITKEQLFSNLDAEYDTVVSAGKQPPSPSVFSYGAHYKEAVVNFERAYIEEILKECNGNVTLASKKLGLHRSSIYNKLTPPQKS